jgi:hypothetical protein
MNYMMKGISMLTAAQVLRLVANASFRPMDSYDRDIFAGTESPNPLIHYADQFCEVYTIILDGEIVCLIDEEGNEQKFRLGERLFA